MSDATRDVWMWGSDEQTNGEADTPLPLPPDDPPVRWAGEDESYDLTLWVPQITVPTDGRSVKGVPINDHIQGVWTHWVDRRTVPCQGRANGCPGCAVGAVGRLTGYILVSRLDLVPAVLTLPAGVLYARPGLRKPGAGLRGRLLTARRESAGRNGHVCLTVSDGQAKLGAGVVLPPDQPIRPLLLRLWGLA